MVSFKRNNKSAKVTQVGMSNLW